MNKPGEKRVETAENELSEKELEQVNGGGSFQQVAFEYGRLQVKNGPHTAGKLELPAVQKK